MGGAAKIGSFLATVTKCCYYNHSSFSIIQNLTMRLKDEFTV